MRSSTDETMFNADPGADPGTSRRMPEPVKGARDQFAAGYATLDQAETGPYTRKERRGLAPGVNYTTRY